MRDRISDDGTVEGYYVETDYAELVSASWVASGKYFEIVGDPGGPGHVAIRLTKDQMKALFALADEPNDVHTRAVKDSDDERLS